MGELALPTKEIKDDLLAYNGPTTPLLKEVINTENTMDM